MMFPRGVLDRRELAMSQQTAINTSQLSKRYGRVRALRAVDLAVQRGEIFGLLGPNGAGKSTLIRILVGLVRPTAGKAWVLGHRAASTAARRNGIVGALVEQPAFYSYLSGRRNLELLTGLSGGCSSDDIDRALELVGLTERQHQKVAGYSAGMRQRLGLAQALLPAAELLILDEPASGLDPRGLVEVRSLLHRLSREEGITVFLSSHLLHEVAQLCSHVGIIIDGRLVVQGSVAELLSASQIHVQVRTSDSARAAAVLERYEGVDQVEVLSDVVHLACAPEKVAEINAALVGENIAVHALIPQGESLEQLYMRLTGKDGIAGG